MPRDLQSLLDRADISDLLIDYGTAIDARDFAALDRIFTADAVIDYRATGGPLCTLEEARQFLAKALPQFPRSQHMMGNISIALQGATATARTMCHNPMVMRQPDGSEKVMFFGIWYADELVRTGDGWRIQNRCLEFATPITIKGVFDMLMRNKVVVVSGIGPGLGIKLAVEAAREGAHAVVAAARTAAKLDEAEQRIRELGVDCQVLKVTADITDRQQCKHLADQAIGRFGRIDALVNSAFVHGKFPEPIEEADLDGWRSVFDTNVFGTMNLTLEVVPHMKQRGSGAIVMINTQAVRKPFPGESGYAASKGALAVAVKYLARELGPHGIRANSIHMGWMWGAPVQEHVRQAAAAYNVPQEQIIAPIAANIALGHIPTDDDCAKAALFLVSDYAKVITGATLDANGGDFMP